MTKETPAKKTASIKFDDEKCAVDVLLPGSAQKADCASSRIPTFVADHVLAQAAAGSTEDIAVSGNTLAGRVQNTNARYIWIM